MAVAITAMSRAKPKKDTNRQFDFLGMPSRGLPASSCTSAIPLMEAGVS